MKRTRKITKWLRRHSKDIIIDSLIVIFVVCIVSISAVLIWVSTLEIPDLSSFEDRRILQTTKIYDRTGEIILYDLNEDVRRTIIPFEEMSRHIKNATIAIEDERFYTHPGVDIRGIMRSAVVNLRRGDLLGGQGGSTITQQVIKNSVLQREKSLTRKVKEAILSLKLERVLSKDEILAVYLNESPYGGTIYGVEEASRAFFGKPASEVSLVEAAYLAALPQAPTFMSPYGNNRNALESRKNIVLERMYLNNQITAEERDEARDTVVEFQPAALTGIRAPHFVMYIREQLVQKFGEEALAERGFRVITTLDYELQAEAERIVQERALSNTERFNASNASLVAADPQTGEVLVMVGSRDYFDEEIDGNVNVALAERQPGSSIKPFIYATAFTKGFLPNTIVFDVKTQFSPACDAWNTTSISPCYSPNNYNNQFIGPVSLRVALASSLNIPAVKTLHLAGLRDSLKLANDMGLTTLNDPARYGLTLVLGGGEVRLLDMTHAYGVFANEGVKVTPRSILRIEEGRGNVIYESDVVSERILDRNVALMISDILSDRVARAPLWGSGSLLDIPNHDVAAKTGSTNNFYDGWLVGYTPNLVVGTWVGNNIPSSMRGLSGLVVTPMWREFMDFAITKRENDRFAQPVIDTAGVKPILRGDYIDSSVVFNQLQSGGEIPEGGLTIASVIGNIHNILHFVDKNNPRGPIPQNPRLDSHYDNWEWAVQQWVQATYGGLLSSLGDSTLESGGDETEDSNESDLEQDN